MCISACPCCDTNVYTLQVASLYTNIPNPQGLEAARQALTQIRLGSRPPKTDSLITLLSKVLSMNTFDLAGKHFLQVGGTAKGAKVAPSVANTLMGWFEAQFVYTYELQPLLWVRFIDDTFLIWTHGQDVLRTFENYLNGCVPSIKFETETSLKEIHFLDVTVNLTEGIPSTTLYTKPTDAHNYLRFMLCHPKNCKAAIP